MKKILIIDDSALMRRVMSDIINADTQLEVADIAINGVRGLELLDEGKTYDAIVLDINMPKMNGVEFLEEMQKKHINIRTVVVSSMATRSTQETIRALELGAFDFVRKPQIDQNNSMDDFKSNLLSVLYLAADVSKAQTKDIDWDKIRELAGRSNGRAVSKEEPKDIMAKEQKEAPKRSSDEVAAKKDVAERKAIVSQLAAKSKGEGKFFFIASSTGGPKSLQKVIPKFPADFPYPIVVVQHMPQGFTQSLASRLEELSSLKVVETEDGMEMKAGCVYIAQGGAHTYLSQTGKNSYKFIVNHEPPRNALRPCADVFLESVAETQFEEIICGVLTGMGDDATRGLAYLKQYQKLKIVAQDEASCVVYGMPRAVFEAGLVDDVVPLEKVAETMMSKLKN